MKYTAKTTLFNLDKINYEALGKKNRESKKAFTIDLKFVAEFLALVKEEAMVSNKFDFPVDIYFEINGRIDPACFIDFKPDQDLMPHLHVGRTEMTAYIRQQDLKNESFSPKSLFESFCCNYIGFISQYNNRPYCKIDFDFVLPIVSKIDSLLVCNGALYNASLSTGFYNVTLKTSIDSFIVTTSLTNFSVHSKAMMNDSSLFYISINFSENKLSYDIKRTEIKLYMYGQLINLSYDEFISAENSLIESAIISTLKLKKIDISNISELKNEFTLQEMMSI